jgi:hypothetical protein
MGIDGSVLLMVCTPKNDYVLLAAAIPKLIG